jgi:hypothetical protein
MVLGLGLELDCGILYWVGLRSDSTLWVCGIVAAKIECDVGWTVTKWLYLDMKESQVVFYMQHRSARKVCYPPRSATMNCYYI